MLHITFFTEFPWTPKIIEHALLEEGVAGFELKGSIGQLHLVVDDEARFYALRVMDLLSSLSLASRIRYYTEEDLTDVVAF